MLPIIEDCGVNDTTIAFQQCGPVVECIPFSRQNLARPTKRATSKALMLC